MCKYCERKPVFSNGYHMYYENETDLGEPGYAALRIGVDEDGRIYLAALGDDRVIWYPNFCPVCGRPLREHTAAIEDVLYGGI